MKLSVKELRIGNKVKYENTIVEIVCINPVTVRIKDNNTFVEVYHKDIEPIPLTEEILLKYGFEEHFRTIPFFTHVDVNFQIRFSKTKGAQIRFSHTDKNNWREFKFIHLLQNLYYFASGEELEINL